MPCLSRLFRSKSSLKSDSKLGDVSTQAGPEIDSTSLTPEQVARLRKQVNEAQHALTQLDVLLSSHQDKTDDSPDVPKGSRHPSSSTKGSVAFHLKDIKRSTKALTRILRKNAPLPPTPTTTPMSPLAASTARSESYPAPLRLPRRGEPATAAQNTHHEAQAPFVEEIGFLDAQLRQRHSSNSALPCRKPSRNRPTSLPTSTYDRMDTYNNKNNPQFSTDLKTQRLRSMQRPVSRVDNQQPLEMEELMTFLRAGHSMREL